MIIITSKQKIVNKANNFQSMLDLYITFFNTTFTLEPFECEKPIKNHS